MMKSMSGFGAGSISTRVHLKTKPQCKWMKVFSITTNQLRFNRKNMRNDPIDGQTKRLLETQIFPQEGVETLIIFLRVFDDKKIAPIRRDTSDDVPSPAASPKDRREPSDGGKRKGRIICLSGSLLSINNHYLIQYFTNR
jgi:hypothetical protein